VVASVKRTLTQRNTMSEKQSGLGAYFEELKRRKVMSVVIAYVVGARLLMQMAEMDWMKNDSDLDNLRDHPRFKALLTQK
jgi:hypothetical protein